MPFAKKVISGDGSAIGGDVINKINDRLDEVDLQLDTKANKTEIPTKTSQLENDSGFTTETYDDSAIKNQIKILDDKIDEVDSQLEQSVKKNELLYNVKDFKSIDEIVELIKENNGGTLFFPKGEYIISKSIKLTSNMNIKGDNATLIANECPAIKNISDGGGDDFEGNNMRNIIIEGLIIKNTVGTFSEHKHLINLSAISELTIRSCKFIGWQGDAINIDGNAFVYGLLRHNKNITIENCYFDGVNKNNRQCISVTSIDGLFVNNCHFTNSTNNSMPGAIDLEPNEEPVQNTIKNVTIINNTFEDIGGNAGVISVLLPNSQDDMTNKSENITIQNNKIKNCNNCGIAITQKGNTETSYPNNIIVKDNFIIDCSVGFIVLGVNNAVIDNNVFKNVKHSYLGSSIGNTKQVSALSFTNNRVLDCSRSGSGYFLILESCKDVDISNNIFKDIGYVDETQGVCIYIDNKANVSDINIVNNIFKNTKNRITWYSVSCNSNSSILNLNFDSNIVSDNIKIGRDIIYNQKNKLSVYFEELPDSATSKTPESFNLGITHILVNGDEGLPTGEGKLQGILETRVLSKTVGYHIFTTQIFHPCDNGSNTRECIYKRYATSLSSWGNWVKISGEII